MDRDAPSELAIIANLLAEDELGAALDALAGALQPEIAINTEPRLRRLHQEVILHKSALSRLVRKSRESGAGQAEDVDERARLTASVLDLVDEMIRVECNGRFRFRVLVGPRQSARLVGGSDGRTGVDVFLSYAREDRAVAVDMAGRMRSWGCAVWFDHFLVGGQRFHDVINSRLDKANAVVVLWTKNSIVSDWVVYEANRAHSANKMVPVRHPSVNMDSIPAPFAAVLHVIEYGDRNGLARALRHFGMAVSNE